MRRVAWRTLLPGGWVALAILLCIVLGVPCLIAPLLGQELTSAGAVNLVFAALVISWYVLDALVSRRAIYQFFGILEPPINPLLRFWRRVFLLGSGIGTAGVLVAQDTATTTSTIGQTQILTLLIGPALAAFGWMYTTFEKEKSDRAAKTLTAIQEQIYGTHMRELMAELTAFRRHCRDMGNYKLTDPLPLETMELTLGDIPKAKRPAGNDDRSLGQAIDQFLNAVDLLAFGVRQGELDFRAVEMVLRQRIVKTAYFFTDYIASETDAELIDGRSQRYRARRKTWEHYLWLVANLPIAPDDGIIEDDIILPPIFDKI